jgi:hypothetical protein
MAGSALVKKHIAILKSLDGHNVQAGWFESDRYGATGEASVGEPVARIARILEFGGTFQHPGGTKYVQLPNGQTKFVSNSFMGPHKVTAAHSITIPPRAFMRLAWSNFQRSRKQIQSRIAKDLISGKISTEQALGQIGISLENCIALSMKNGGWQGNAASTIRQKGFDKPLFGTTGTMFKTINSKVT